MRLFQILSKAVCRCAAALSLIALAACSDDHEWGQVGETAMTLPESVSAMLDFEITFDDADEAVYGAAEDTIVTDPSADGYADFVENHTFASKVTITYNGETATVSGAESGIDIAQDGAHVVVSSSQPEVEYVLTGNSANGSFKIYSDEAFRLSLSGVTLNNPVGAAVNIQSKVRAFVTCEEGTDNSLSDGEEYEETDGEDMKACLFSEGALIFGGTGSLRVTGNHNHAITSDSHMRFRAGCHVTVEAAANDGIHTNDQITIGGGVISVVSEGDAIQCGDEGITLTGGFLRLSPTGDGSDALKADQGVIVYGGAVQAEVTGAAGKGVNCGSFAMSGGKLTVINRGEAMYDEDDEDISSAAGIKCDGDMHIADGKLALLSTGAAGKGINCDGRLDISGGLVMVETTGQQYILGHLDSSAKGIKADGDLTISGDAEVMVKATGGEGSEGVESKATLRVDGGQVALLCYDDAMNASDAIEINGGTLYCCSTGNDGIDSNGTLSVTGGLTVAIGTGTPEGGIDCDRNDFSITGGVLLGIGGTSSVPTTGITTQPTIIYSGTAENGQPLRIESADGTDALTVQMPGKYSRMTLLFSSPTLRQGESYVLYTGGTISGGTELYGYYSDATYSNGTEQRAFTLSSIVTSI